MIVILGAAGYYVASRMNFNYYKNYIGLISNKEDLLGEDSYNKINGLYDVIESSFLFDFFEVINTTKSNTINNTAHIIKIIIKLLSIVLPQFLIISSSIYLLFFSLLISFLF